MDDSIQITNDLRFGYEDLMKEVDFSHEFSQEFTLRDVLSACVNSKIPPKNLSAILRCKYINDYWTESNKKPFKNDGEIEYLEVYLTANIDLFDGNRYDTCSWGFHGRGKKGDFPKELEIIKKYTKEEKANYREKYAIEYTPLYELVDYPIKVCNEIEFSDYSGKKNKYRLIDFQPSITLIELLFAIFNELSELGSPSNRDKEFKDLKELLDERIKNIGKSKKYSSKEVFDRVTKKINSIRKENK